MRMNTLDFITRPERKSFSVQHGETVDNSNPLVNLKSCNGSTCATIDGHGKASFSALNISSLPTSSAGLSSGDIWADNGTLKVVP